jgi:hypothetical protein
VSESQQGLKVQLEQSAQHSRVWLDGTEISRYIRSIKIDASVGDVTTAVIEYSGAITVTGEAGRIELQQAPHYVECESCHKAVRGEKQEPTIIDTTTIGDEFKEHEAVTE